jgi:hypothetical protein
VRAKKEKNTNHEIHNFGAVQKSAQLDYRSRKMLQNENLVAKIGVHTAENELSKVCRKWGPEWQGQG